MAQRSRKPGRELKGAPPPRTTAPGAEPAPIGSGRRALNTALPVAIPVLFFVLVWTFYPFRHVSEFDPDEGNNVIKALMMSRGHTLYREIWSDQPPLFTYLLRGWLAVTGWSAHSARVLVLLCSCVLLWALYATVRPTWGHGAAVASVGLLATSWYYVALSVSAMLAIPTLMLAMLSMACVVKFRRHPHPAWAAFSGVFLALSLFTKLFALPLAPLIVLAIVHAGGSLGRETGRGGFRLRALAYWLSGFAVAAAVLFVTLIPWSEIDQLIRPHLDARKQMAGKGWDETYLDFLREDWGRWLVGQPEEQPSRAKQAPPLGYALLGVIGLVHVVRRREWPSLVPVIWYGLSALALSRHRPLWYHHYLLLSVPMCWMAASALGPALSLESWRSARRVNGFGPVMSSAAVGLALLVALAAVVQAPTRLSREVEYAQRYVRMTPRDDYIAAVMKQFKDNTHYVITDRQMLPFMAGLIVPPELSVTSVKRFQSGHLSIERLLELFEKYRPEQVLLSWRKRIRPNADLQAYLLSHYRLIYTNTLIHSNPPGDLLYVTPGLADNALAALEQAVAQVPQSEDGWYNLGVQLAEAGRDDEAVGKLERSIRLRPTRAAYEHLAKALQRLGKNEDAAEARRRAEQLKR